MSPFILKHQRFVTGTWRICLQRNGSGQIDLNLAHWKKRASAYKSLQFPVEMNTDGKTPTTFIAFHTKYDSRGRVSIRL